MIMNKIQIYIPVLILALAASSCSKVLEKDEAEASFARKGELPEVSDVKLVSVDEYAGTAVVEATFSGISDDMHSLEIGFISADDYALTGTTNQRNRALIDNPADGTYRRTIAVSAGVPNYIVAMAASDDGAVYSRRLSVDVPDVPWQYKVGEEYSGTVTSYNDGSSTYEHTVRLEFSADFSRLTVYDIDPYLRANLLGADDGYAVDEIRKMLAGLQPPAGKFVLPEEEAEAGYEILFDGTDLSKWTGDMDGYTPVNGTIFVTAGYGNARNLYTVKEYRDFILRFDFCFVKPGVNNGVGIRTPMGVDAAYWGMCEVQILDHDDPIYKGLNEYQVHGSAYGIIPAKRVIHRPLGEWNSEEIKVVGDRVTVTLNGEVILDGNLREACQGHNVAPDGNDYNPYTVDHRNHPGMFNEKGHVGFLGHGAGIKFRNVRILDLSE